MHSDRLAEWLKTQEKEFQDEVNNNMDMLGDGQFTVEKLRELDNKYNPEGNND